MGIDGHSELEKLISIIDYLYHCRVISSVFVIFSHDMILSYFAPNNAQL